MRERVRTWLYAPGNRPDLCQKAMDSSADQVIWDLEDAVSEEHKVAARKMVTQLIAKEHPRQAWVRINGLDTPWGLDDLETMANIDGPNLRVVLPKATFQVAQEIQARGYGGEWLLIIETAQGLRDVVGVARAWPLSRARFAFGALDYRNDIGALETQDEWELVVPRSLLVIASRAWGWPAPIDAVFPGITDQKAIEVAARRGRGLGMAGKMIIHPQQIAPVHTAYAPTEDEIGWAREVLDATQTTGVAQVRGMMVDRPAIQRAREILERKEDK